jgi:hypothetical protein
LEKFNYPNPCDKCDNFCKDRFVDKAKTCGLYRHRLDALFRWLRMILPEPKPVVVYEEKFCYEHPDVIREYLATSPCDKCPATDCDVPCSVYLRWYDAKIEQVKARIL